MRLIKIVQVFLLLLCLNIVKAQDSETLKVQKTIETFFKGFHSQDSLLLSSCVASRVLMQTIGVDKETGNTELKDVNFDKFLTSILKIPDSINFQEKLLSFNIQIDGDMAHAWTPYQFWYNESLSHCGVNSFQLIKERDQWKIIYIIDTRRKEPCS